MSVTEDRYRQEVRRAPGVASRGRPPTVRGAGEDHASRVVRCAHGTHAERSARAETVREHGDHAPGRRPTSSHRRRAPAVEVRRPRQALPEGHDQRGRRDLASRSRPGEVFGLLGPNGAGKTTTIGVLTTRVRKTSGRATVAGIDVAADPVGARAVLGVVPQRPNLDRSLDARANLVWHAAYHGVPRARRGPLADELLDRMGLADKATTNPDELSGGQAQRLIIARGLMHDPQVLFLDEPSTGLDPQARLFVHDRVAELAASGVTVVLTTHDMDEAAKLVRPRRHRRPRQAARPRHAVRAGRGRCPGRPRSTSTVTGADAGRAARAARRACAGTAGAEVLDAGEAHRAAQCACAPACDGEAGAALPGLLDEVADGGRPRPRRRARRADARGRLHRPDGAGAAMSAATIPATARSSRRATTTRAFLGVLGRDVAVTGTRVRAASSPRSSCSRSSCCSCSARCSASSATSRPGYAQLLLPGPARAQRVPRRRAGGRRCPW